MEKLFLKIRRQDHPESTPYWEHFQVPHHPRMTVIAALMEIQKNPINRKTQATTPVVWECNCLQGACGSCTMVIDGKVQLACTTLISDSGKPLTLEPLSRFPVLRDLIVDRSRMEANLKKVHAWVSVDSSEARPSAGRSYAAEDTERALKLASCIQCGACLEACPQFHPDSSYMGAHPFTFVHRLNFHSTGSADIHQRMGSLMEEGGIQDCGNAQNCEKACPEKIPLLSTIARLNRQLTSHFIRKVLGE